MKLFSPERWDTAQKAVARRTTLQNDYFFCVSEEIRKIEQPEGKYYHTNVSVVSALLKDYLRLTVIGWQRLEADSDYVVALQSLTTEEVEIPGVTSFVCSL